MKFNTMPLYNDIFIDEEMPSKENLLKQTPTDAIIRKRCAINAHLQDCKDQIERGRREN